jgi:hypothetical protein
MKDSIEERFLRVQSAKAALGKASTEKLGKEEQTKAKLTAMKDLFESLRHGGDGVGRQLHCR